jgi:hypothetical protein
MPKGSARAPVVRRVLLVAWLVVGAALWNGVFDLYLSRGVREYLQLRAEAEAGAGDVPDMRVVLAIHRRDGLVAASLWAGLVTSLGLLTLRWSAQGRPGAEAVRSITSESGNTT